jgi:hypothetical protein
MSSLEIKVGFENPSNDDPRYLNNFWGFVEKPLDPINITNTSSNNNSNNTFFNVTYGSVINKRAYVLVNVNCFGADDLQGRYITIQKRDCGQLEIHEITFTPSPSNYFFLLTDVKALFELK